MKTITINLYSFNELSDEAKQKVLKNFRDINVDFNDWYEPIYEGFKEDAQKQGFNVDKIYFSGFWSQGDGAMFEGSINSNLKINVPNRIQKLIDKNLVEIFCTFKHSGHYYHHKSYSNNYSVDTNGLNSNDNIVNLLYSKENEITDKYEELCKYLYKRLERYYTELTTDESVIETINVNNYTFEQDGTERNV